MKRKILVSRQGLTQCPGCQAHIKLDEQIELTDCPFCGGSLLSDQSEGASPMQLVRRLSSSRSGLLAASLFGLSLAACAGTPGTPDGAKKEGVVQERAPDGGNSALYGIPADMRPGEIKTEQAPDGGNQALYGAPADRKPVDNGPLPPYGIPPDR